MSMNFCGVPLRNPIMTASGTVAYGAELNAYTPLASIGALIVKSVTLTSRAGNKPPRIAECTAGILNSVGLQNPGIDYVVEHYTDWLRGVPCAVVGNIAGESPEEYAVVARRLVATGVYDMLEVNLSCPNVAANNATMCADLDVMTEVIRGVKAVADVPVIAKLAPDLFRIDELCRAAVAAGADALTLINTVPAMRFDRRTGKPLLGNVMGGLSGQAILPIALRCVYIAANTVDVPIIGCGGVSSADDVREMQYAGASCVQVGTAAICDPTVLGEICGALENFA